MERILMNRRYVAELLIVFFSAFIALLFIVSLADAANCRNGICNVRQQAVVKQRVVKQAVVSQPVVYAQPKVYYAVAPHLQDRAALRHELRQLLQEEIRPVIQQELRSAVQKLQQPPAQQANQYAPCETCQSPEQPLAPSALSHPQSVLGASCAKCHSGENPKGDFSIDLELNDATRAKIARQVLSNRMPRNADGDPQPLSNEEKSRLLLELFSTTHEGE